MLANLHVRNLGIVSEAEIDFGSGLNIITGETGAGKSLLIDALSIVRGSRFVAGLIGPFGDSSSVTATFQIPPGHRVFEKLGKWGLEDSCHESCIVIRRVCTSAGRTKNYVNDVPVHLRSVVELATELVDISSQFANQRLLDERSHLQYLDAFAGSNALRGSFDAAFQSASLPRCGDVVPSSTAKRRCSKPRLQILTAFPPVLKTTTRSKRSLSNLNG
jgi:DNA repair protein RecN (Recombination protein N)